MLFTYEYIIRDEGRDGVRHNEYMRRQALHTNYFRSKRRGNTTHDHHTMSLHCYFEGVILIPLEWIFRGVKKCELF
jgi:hypothetical protein